MAWVACNKRGQEIVCKDMPVRHFLLPNWCSGGCIVLPKGSIKKLIGRELTWEDECVELKEE